MAQLTKENFYAKWVPLFADNDFQHIDGPRLALFLADLRDTFAPDAPDAANVPLYDPATAFVRGFVVRYAIAGQPMAFYFALKAGLLPAPTGQASDPNWQVVPGPTSVTALSQVVTLVQAQGLQKTASAVDGRVYAVNFGPDAQGQARTVYVPGLGGKFDIEGRLLSGNTLSRVLVDVAAGTVSPVASGGGGGVAYDGLPGGPIELPVDGPQDITIPAGIQLTTVWWNALQPEGDYLRVSLLAACYDLTGTTLTLNDHIEGLLQGDTIDLSYSL